MVKHARKKIFGTRFHSLAQAYLNTRQDFEEWQKHPSRRNVRKNLRKAVENGFELRIVSFPEVEVEVESMEIKRGET